MKRLDKAIELVERMKKRDDLGNQLRDIAKQAEEYNQEGAALRDKFYETDAGIQVLTRQERQIAVRLKKAKKELSEISEQLQAVSEQFKEKSAEFETVSAEHQALEKSIQETWDNATRVHIVSLRLSQYPDKEAYDQLFYVPEIDYFAITTSNTPESSRSNLIDFREFFNSYGFPVKGKYISNRLGSGSRNILRAIISDLFAKNDYQSWEEAFEDIKTIPEHYPQPTTFESAKAYAARVGIKPKQL